MARLWDKKESIDDQVLRYTVGDDHRWDERLVRYDIEASTAHVRMLADCGYLSAEDRDAIVNTLADIGAEHERGEWSISLEEEDCHTALEGRLTERLGDAGARIHLGRSRNDQVLAALRLYLKHEITELAAGARAVVAALGTLIEQQGDIGLPGYTHQQRAMPSSVRAWAGAYAREIEDDRAGLERALARVDLNPLGSAAGYGVPVVKIDRRKTRDILGFREVQEPVTSVQLSRGKAEATVLFELSLLMQDLGRLSADVCLFATQEFAFVALPTAFTTGSSIMPQKRNPDLFELVRGRSTQVLADLTAALMLTTKMTSGYHRDLQLLKAPLFRSIDSTRETLALMAHAIPELQFNRNQTEAALDPTLYATQRAYELVESEGIPFREAYRRVGEELGKPS